MTSSSVPDRALRSRQFAAGIPALVVRAARVGTFVIFAASALLEGVGMAAFSDPIGWLSRFDHDAEASILLSASQVMAGLLADRDHGVAIVVELAATRYNHRITLLFVREPVNIAACRCSWSRRCSASGWASAGDRRDGTTVPAPRSP